MTKDEIEKLKKYKDYPDGSPARAIYDRFHIPFEEYLKKYYESPDLHHWYYCTGKFVKPLFEKSSYAEYRKFLLQVKPSFDPNLDKCIFFMNQINDDKRFDIELKEFFSFLYSIDFFRDLTFDQWLNVTYWSHPWFKDENEYSKTISEIIKYEYGLNFLKASLAGLSIFTLK